MNPIARPLLITLLTALAFATAQAADAPLAPVLQNAVDKHLAAGIVTLVADRDHVLDLEAAGYSNLTTKAPMQTNSVFWIASMTKSFTGAALLMLVDEGKVKLDDPVEKFLPEFKGQMVAEEGKPPHPPQHPVTVREIMDHTSGVATPQDPAFKNAHTLAEIVAVVGKLPLLREPGTKFQYNNSGINTGGRIIEVVSGMPYADFMQQRLFTPLGMKDTSFWPNEELAGRLANSSKFTADKSGLEDVGMRKNLTQPLIDKLSQGVVVPAPMLDNFGGGIIPDYVYHYAQPAGGLFSTASDVGKFCQMLLSGGTWQGHHYLSADALKLMSAVQTGDVQVNPQEGYGVGVFVKKRDDDGPSVGSFGHRGARKTDMWVDPTHHIVMVLMVQCWEMTGAQQKELSTSFFKAAVEKYGRKP